MMNGSRKSDRPVVATKPANKVGVTAHDTEAQTAEQVEQRGLAKGKTAGEVHQPHAPHLQLEYSARSLLWAEA